MKFKAVINGCEHHNGYDPERLNAMVSGVAYDSRKASKGCIFVAITGENVDGHNFIADAIKGGAVAIVHEKPLDTGQLDVSEIHKPVFIRSRDSRKTLACISNNFYGRPSEKLTVIGVTGTNGKTTTAYLIRSVLEAWNKDTGLIGTISWFIKNRAYPALHTTPEAPDFQGLLKEMSATGCSHVITEVSSHALSLSRVDYTRFAVAVFTNLTRDHLDFHMTMEDYYSAKKRLFVELLTKTGTAVIYTDDAWGRRLSSELCEEIAENKQRMLTYGIGSPADVMALDIESSLAGLSFVLRYRDIFLKIASPLVGTVNVCNILAAVAVAIALDVPMDVIGKGIRNMAPVKGRLERIDEGQDFLCLVDYAHTPDALERLLLTAKGLLSQKPDKAEGERLHTELTRSKLPNPSCSSGSGHSGRIITVFGCGGNRDHGKRPVMGEIAARLSDYVIITSDNPRREDPLSIIKEIESGITADNYIGVADRRRAINMAIEKAETGDIVIIAGKGHEDYQEIGTQSYKFSDGEVAGEAIRDKNLASEVQDKIYGIPDH